jgi:hypothetical protein
LLRIFSTYTSIQEILDANDALRERHEKEMLELNMRLVQTLQESSNENIDPEAAKDLLSKVQELQAEYARKVREYEDTVSRHTEERHALSQKYALYLLIFSFNLHLGLSFNRNEEEIRQLRKEIKQLGEEQRNGEPKGEKLAKLRELLDQKSSTLADNESSSPEDSQLKEEIESAKSKHAELSEKLKLKKQELSSMMTKRQEEIGHLSRQVSDQKESETEEDEGTTEKSEGTLKERLSKLSSLRGLISVEMKERERLKQEIQRLEKGSSSKRNASKSKGLEETGSNKPSAGNVTLDKESAPASGTESQQQELQNSELNSKHDQLEPADSNESLQQSTATGSKNLAPSSKADERLKSSSHQKSVQNQPDERTVSSMVENESSVNGNMTSSKVDQGTGKSSSHHTVASGNIVQTSGKLSSPSEKTSWRPNKESAPTSDKPSGSGSTIPSSVQQKSSTSPTSPAPGNTSMKSSHVKSSGKDVTQGQSSSRAAEVEPATSSSKTVASFDPSKAQSAVHTMTDKGAEPSNRTAYEKYYEPETSAATNKDSSRHVPSKSSIHSKRTLPVEPNSEELSQSKAQQSSQHRTGKLSSVFSKQATSEMSLPEGKSATKSKQETKKSSLSSKKTAMGETSHDSGKQIPEASKHTIGKSPTSFASQRAVEEESIQEGRLTRTHQSSEKTMSKPPSFNKKTSLSPSNTKEAPSKARKEGHSSKIKAHTDGSGQGVIPEERGFMIERGMQLFGDPIDEILQMIGEKESQIEHLEDTNDFGNQRGISLDHMRKEVENLRSRLPKGYEKKLSNFEQYAERHDNSKLQSKGKSTRVTAGNDQLRLTGINVDKVILYEKESTSPETQSQLSYNETHSHAISSVSQYASSD